MSEFADEMHADPFFSAFESYDETESDYLDMMAQREIDDWENREQYGIEW